MWNGVKQLVRMEVLPSLHTPDQPAQKPPSNTYTILAMPRRRNRSEAYLQGTAEVAHKHFLIHITYVLARVSLRISHWNLKVHVAQTHTVSTTSQPTAHSETSPCKLTLFLLWESPWATLSQENPSYGLVMQPRWRQFEMYISLSSNNRFIIVSCEIHNSFLVNGRPKNMW